MTHKNESPESKPIRPNFFRAILAVLSAFIGIRKRSSSFADQGIKPAHIVISALICVVGLVVLVNILVRIIISNATHQ